jgi:GAF domain-containing protein
MGTRAIARAAREAIPNLADFCLVHLVAGNALTCVAGAHSTPGGTRNMRALMKAQRIALDDRFSTVATVVRTRRATIRRDIYPDDEAAGQLSELQRKLAPTSALVVPIVTDRGVLGAISLCYSHSGRSYAARHLALAKRLALRLAETLTPRQPADAAHGLRAAARHARQGTTLRRRVAARN